MSQERWIRMLGSLTEAGIKARLDEKPYSETYRGRPRSGVSRSVTITVPGRGLVTVDDKYWSQNLDVWVGWTVTAEDRDGITVGRPSSPIKNRASVVNDVRSAMKRLGA